MGLPKKSLPLSHLRSCLNQRDRATTCGSVLVRAHRKLGKKKSTPGALPATSRQHLEHPVFFFAVKQATAGFKCNNSNQGKSPRSSHRTRKRGKAHPDTSPTTETRPRSRGRRSAHAGERLSFGRLASCMAAGRGATEVYWMLRLGALCVMWSISNLLRVACFIFSVSVEPFYCT